MNLIPEICIQTKDSVLATYSFEHNKELIDNCVREITGKLLVKPQIKLFGKICHQRRNVAFFSDESIGYYYSNQLMRSQKMSPYLTKLLEIINENFDSNYNGILVNQYINGNDYIGKHSDDESGLANNNTGVVAISVGTPRKFRIRDKITNKIVMDIPTKSYHILHMGGKFQEEFTHEIPIEKKITTGRISFTFRHHIQ